ncbi:hypothetical protein ABPG74_013085 [Tetrahymena malaccensis]
MYQMYGYSNQIEQTKKVKDHFQQYIQKNQDILDSSLNKKIVCAFGLTGSGKSTLLNLLCDKPLYAYKEGSVRKIALQEPYGQDNFKIGQNTESFTILPQYSDKNGLRFYDFAGLNDNRGVEYSILNACFIKQIMQKASSVIFLFVVEYASLASTKGEQFLDLISRIKNFVPEITDTQYINGLVITKSECSNMQEFETDIKSQNFPLKDLDKQIMLKKFKVSRPDDKNRIHYEDRDHIMNFLQIQPGKKYQQVNVEAIYHLKESNIIDCLYSNEMDPIIEYLTQPKDYFSMTIEDLENETDLTINLQQYFQEAIQNNDMINLLKPISQKNFDNIFRNFIQKIVKEQIEILQKIELIKSKKIDDIEKQDLKEQQKRFDQQREQKSKKGLFQVKLELPF